MNRLLLLVPLAMVLIAVVVPSISIRADDLDIVRKAEEDRIKVINQVRPAVVALFAPGGGNGGSGVLIDKEGYLLTNFHVVAATGPLMKCGLPDGILYDGVLVGIDKVGDVALVKLLPKKEGTPFPTVPMGNSDLVKAGEWSIAMGNPFLLATDFSPTVTYGLISGVNRYQYPDSKDGSLEYTDCIQIDTSINPGNSGGPLFNMKGELIGINGRGSFDKRSRINSGVGYAISINQIKNFLGHLYAGLATDHATLGATVSTDTDEADIARMVVREILDEADIARRGVQSNDELVSFGGRAITSTNQYKNILGIYPKEWRMPLVYRRGNDRKETLVRLMGVQAVEVQAKQPNQPQPRPVQPPQPKGPASPAAKFYKTQKGFANFYFNELARDRVLASAKKLADFTNVSGNWSFSGSASMEGRDGELKVEISEVKDAEDMKQTKPVAKIRLNSTDYVVEPLKRGLGELDLIEPPNSGGLLVALYQYRRFLTLGAKGFEGGNFTHGGQEPIYPQPLDNAKKSLKDTRVMTEVIRTDHVAVAGKWYFFRKDLNPNRPDLTYPDGALIGFEIFISKDADPCEVYLHDYQATNGRMLPMNMEIRNGDKRYALFTIRNWSLGETPK